ncbi:peptidyl-prolyl cis trans isomerase [Paramyrothecium foliicola]|nr:peptidyl-prolyl cis trans isomerase [Paramyrothecium foliicola]
MHRMAGTWGHHLAPPPRCRRRSHEPHDPLNPAREKQSSTFGIVGWVPLLGFGSYSSSVFSSLRFLLFPRANANAQHLAPAASASAALPTKSQPASQPANQPAGDVIASPTRPTSILSILRPLLLTFVSRLDLSRAFPPNLPFSFLLNCQSFQEADSSETGLPPNWEVRHSNSKNLPYYFNSTDKVSRWEPPAGTDTEKLKHYMAAHHSAGNRAGAAPGIPEGKIRAAHLLVKHRESRRPSSWREADITRSKEDAAAIIREHEGRIRNGEISLGELAMSESDCSSARKRGDLGYFGKGDMQKEFEDAAFALKPGEISGVVETASGLHLIER